MTAKPRRKTSQAPKGRNNPALGNAPQEDQSPEPERSGDRSPTGDRAAVNEVNQRAGQGNGWTVVKSGELFTFVTSGSRGWAKYYSETGPAFLRVGNLDHYSISLDLGDVQRVQPPSGAEGLRTRVQPGDILISITADVGMVGLVPDSFEEAYINQHVALARPNGVFPPYLAWFLSSRAAQKQFRDLQRGATKVGLGLDDIRSIDVPVPPLPDQRRIVAEIEKQFTRLEAGVAALRRVQANLKRYRAAVLKAACEGRLFTAIETASESEDGYGPPKSLPEGWHWTTASEICEAVVDCHNKTAPYTESGIPLVRTTNIRGGKINLENTRFVDQPTYEFWSRRCTPKPGDVLFTREAPMGEAGIIPDGVTLCMGQRMMLLRASPKILNRYLLTGLLTPGLLNHITQTAVGSGVQHLRVRDVESLPIPLPPLAEQTRIVAEVERRLSVVEELDAVVTTNFQRAKRLRQSILQKAFAGEMIAADRAG